MLVVVTSVYRFFRAEDPPAAAGSPQAPSTAVQTSNPEPGPSHTSSSGFPNTTTDGTSSRASTSGTITSRIELTELFDSDFSRPVSEDIAYIQRNSWEKSMSSQDCTVDSNKFG
jgi:hypothetical protein